MSIAATPFILEQPRTAGAIAELLEQRLRAEGFGPDPLREALVAIGARYGEILVEHLNAAPEVMRAAFVGHLPGQAKLPLAAEVVLSFKSVPVPGTEQREITVPMYTTVAAPPEGEDTEPVLFETLADLTLVPGELVRAFVVDPRQMAYADLPDLLLPAGRTAEPMAAALPIEQALYIAAPEVFGREPLSKLSVEVEVLSGGVRPPLALVGWGLQTPEGFLPLAVQADTTLQLTRTGVVELAPPALWPPASVAAVQALWLCCRMLPGESPLPEGASYEPPRIGQLRLQAAAHAAGRPPDAVASGGLPLDASKDYFPFGERPRFGDVFHLSAPAFALPGARVTLEVRLSNPAGSGDGPLPAVRRDGKPGVVWELYTRRGWVPLEATDGTQSLTQDGNVVFTVPQDGAEQTIAGFTGAWVRARLATGHYGASKTVDGLIYPAAPSIAALTVEADVQIGPVAASHLVRSGPFELQVVDSVLTPFYDMFPPLAAAGATLYLGWGVPLLQRKALHERTLNLLVDPLPPPGRAIYREPPAVAPLHDTRLSPAALERAAAPGAAGRLPADHMAAPQRWQLLAADGWHDCEAVDASAGLVRTGVVEVTLPTTPTAWPGFRADPAQALVWLRRVSAPGDPVPRLRRLVANSVRARQTVRLENEVLGSSTGRPHQVFQTLHKPVVGAVVLEVREAAPASDGSAAPVWVRWDAVGDLWASDTRSRHFTLDAASGRVVFGDGKNGRIPPAGPNNVRMRSYHAGGGRRGNRAAGTITQLHTAIPYIEAVTNPVAAVGGQDGATAVAAAPASVWLRHRDRAICAEDYADLARDASREVARAWCRGNITSSGRGAFDAPGVVRVVIVPDADVPRPQPAPDLLARVKAYLDARRPVAVDLVLLGPEYVGVAVEAEVQCGADRSPHVTATACKEQLTAFLHPLTGNVDGQGWVPGQRPHRSDLIAALGAVDGVDHVESVRLQIDEAALEDPGMALVAAGTIKVLV